MEEQISHQTKIRNMKISRFLGYIAILAISSTEAVEPGARRPSAETIAHACAGCHGTDGYSKAPTPAISGIKEEDFIAAMRGFKSGERASSIMNRIARGYTDEDFLDMAQFFKNR